MQVEFNMHMIWRESRLYNMIIKIIAERDKLIM